MGPIKGHYVPSQDSKTLTGIEIDDCKKACEDQTTFKCISFDYYVAVKYCYLQAVDRHSAILTAHAAFDYYERRCDGRRFNVIVFSDSPMCSHGILWHNSG